MAGMPVLVVDDESQIRKLVRLLLVEHGLEAIEAPDGPTALAAAREVNGNVSLLLTDINLDGMSGIELARAVTAEFAHIPVLFMSTAPPSQLTLCECAPGSAFLMKPFGADMLIQAVQNLCGATAA
jgi:CheY-like chemotaxis protein